MNFFTLFLFLSSLTVLDVTAGKVALPGFSAPATKENKAKTVEASVTSDGLEATMSCSYGAYRGVEGDVIASISVMLNFHELHAPALA